MLHTLVNCSSLSLLHARPWLTLSTAPLSEPAVSTSAPLLYRRRILSACIRHLFVCAAAPPRCALLHALHARRLSRKRPGRPGLLAGQHWLQLPVAACCWRVKWRARLFQEPVSRVSLGEGVCICSHAACMAPMLAGTVKCTAPPAATNLYGSIAHHLPMAACQCIVVCNRKDSVICIAGMLR